MGWSNSHHTNSLGVREDARCALLADLEHLGVDVADGDGRRRVRVRLEGPLHQTEGDVACRWSVGRKGGPRRPNRGG